MQSSERKLDVVKQAIGEFDEAVGEVLYPKCEEEPLFTGFILRKSA